MPLTAALPAQRPGGKVQARSMGEAACLHPGLTCQALTAALPTQRPGEQFLARRAGEVARLRRRHSARRLQRAWRAFARQRRTTAALAAGFAASGVPALAGIALPQV